MSVRAAIAVTHAAAKGFSRGSSMKYCTQEIAEAAHVGNPTLDEWYRPKGMAFIVMPLERYPFSKLCGPHVLPLLLLPLQALVVTPHKQPL